MSSTPNSTETIESIACILSTILEDPEAPRATTSRRNNDDNQVYCQLVEYVEAIADIYPNNSHFYFERASKAALMIGDYVVRSSSSGSTNFHPTTESCAAAALDRTTKFALVLAAIVQDVGSLHENEHDFICQEPRLCAVYDNQCVAKQYSIEIAWDLLMEDGFQELRQSICGHSDEGTDMAELNRFYQALVACVLATDTSSETYKKSNKKHGFGEREKKEQTSLLVRPYRNFRAPSYNIQTIVMIEFLMQVSKEALNSLLADNRQRPTPHFVGSPRIPTICKWSAYHPRPHN